jgi:hypothetical protein
MLEVTLGSRTNCSYFSQFPLLKRSSHTNATADRNGRLRAIAADTGSS